MMSSSIFLLVQNELIRYGMPIVFILGIIGNVFVVILFSQRRQNSCAMYLSSSAVLNTLVLMILVPLNIHRIEHPDPTNYSLVLCKTRYYVTHTWSQLARFLTTFACIDRFILTTNNSRLLTMNHPRVARKIMMFTIIVYHIFLIHLAIFTTIQNKQCGQFGVYYLLYQIYALIFFFLIPLVLMSVFGYWTYHNMRRLHEHIRSSKRSTNHRDRDLLTMVLVEVLVYAATMFWYPFILLEIAITTYLDINKSTELIQIEGLLSTVGALFVFINSAIAFYLYLIVSKQFRRDFQNLLIRWKSCVRRREHLRV